MSCLSSTMIFNLSIRISSAQRQVNAFYPDWGQKPTSYLSSLDPSLSTLAYPTHKLMTSSTCRPACAQDVILILPLSPIILAWLPRQNLCPLFNYNYHQCGSNFRRNSLMCLTFNFLIASSEVFWILHFYIITQIFFNHCQC